MTDHLRFLGNWFALVGLILFSLGTTVLFGWAATSAALGGIMLIAGLVVGLRR